jgi:hypothetical protein
VPDEMNSAAPFVVAGQLYLRCPMPSEGCDGLGDILIDAPEAPDGFVRAICPTCHGNGFIKYNPTLHGEIRDGEEKAA